MIPTASAAWCFQVRPKIRRFTFLKDTTGFSRVVLQPQPKMKELHFLKDTTGFSRVVLQLQPNWIAETWLQSCQTWHNGVGSELCLRDNCRGSRPTSLRLALRCSNHHPQKRKLMKRRQLVLAHLQSAPPWRVALRRNRARSIFPPAALLPEPLLNPLSF